MANTWMKAAVLMACAAGTAFAAGSGEQAGGAAVKPVELEYFSHKSETVPVMEAIVKKFEAENPGIKIKIVAPPESRTVMLTRISTNEMPDILNSYPAEVLYKTMFDDGLLLDLTGQEFLKNVNEGTIKIASHKGKVFALPMTQSSYGIYYRKDIFAKLGLKAPATYAELIEAAKKIQASGVVPFSFANKDLGNIAQRFERLVGVINNDIDGEFRKIASGSLKASDSPSLKAFSKMTLEITKYGLADSLGVDHQASIADFVNGKAAMLISGTWALGTMKSLDPNIDTEMIPFPNPTGGKTNVPINIDTSFSVSAACKDKDAALKFLAFLAKHEIAQMYCDAEGTPNMVKGVKYNVVQHARIAASMGSGDMFLTAVNLWPTGLREELRTPVQQLIMDGDEAAFLKAAGASIVQYYNKK